jgi:hypothetical protein
MNNFKPNPLSLLSQLKVNNFFMLVIIMVLFSFIMWQVNQIRYDMTLKFKYYDSEMELNVKQKDIPDVKGATTPSGVLKDPIKGNTFNSAQTKVGGKYDKN